MALRLPWWTLRAPFAQLATTAALPDDPQRVMYLLSEEAAAAASATVNRFNYREPKTPKQVGTALGPHGSAAERPSCGTVAGPGTA